MTSRRTTICRARSLVVAIVALIVATGAGCSGCRRTEYIAELLDVSGRADRGAGGVTAWTRASPGTRFMYGDALRTSAGARARVRLGQNGLLHVGPSSTVRFLRQRSARGGAQRNVAVRVDQGEAEVETTAAMEIETAGGTARIERGTRVRIGLAQDETRVQVTLGRVVLERVGGEVLDVGAGQQVVVTLERAEIEPFDPNLGADAGAPTRRETPRPRAPTDAQAADAADVRAEADADADAASDADAVVPDSATDSDLGPDSADPPADNNAARVNDPATPSGSAAAARADLVIAAGESTTVHFTGELLRLGLRMEPECAGTLTASAAGRSAFAPPGARHAVLTLASGLHRYSLRCAQAGTRDRTAAGSVRFSHDTGAGTIAHTAAHSSLDADGRRYTVLYQSVPPDFTFRWPRAPASSGYVLNVRGGAGRTQTWRVGSASRNVSSGQLGEGSYTFWFQAVGRRERSPDTSLVLTFDNNARAAQIREPSDGVVGGSSLRVAGAVLAGGTVSANGVRIPTDPQGRFEGEARAPSDGTAFAIRITLPGRGVHYYLRRVAGAAP